MIIDFGESKEINKITVGCLQSQKSWVFAPENIDYFISKDGKQFESIGSYYNPKATIESEDKQMDIKQGFENIQGRYLKITRRD